MKSLKKIAKNRLFRLLKAKSQKGQDKWVLGDVFPFRFGRFFLDVAAADGITHSNTYLLENTFKWKGLCIEANPYFFEELQRNRSCICVNHALSDKKEKVQFRVDNGQLGGIVADDTDNNPGVRADQLSDAKIIEMEAITLTDILDEHNVPAVIDYFSLDVEGSEERIIRSFDFSKYRFLSLTIERPTPLINQILFENNYQFVKNHMNDTFYVHETVLEIRKIRCEPFEQISPKNW